jgi:hypothetical protein
MRFCSLQTLTGHSLLKALKDLKAVLRVRPDPDPAFHFAADPDSAPHQSDANLRPPVYTPSMALF